MKIIISGTVFLFLFILPASGLEASWKIDPDQFHISAHDRESKQACMECHEDEIIDDHYHISHANVSCMTCHPDSVIVEHDTLKPVDCTQCHLPHDAKITNDVHLALSCKTCHLSDIAPADEGNCTTCHHGSNTFGAAAMVLPAKSILCMPCHTATFSVIDTTTIISLILFFAGMICVGSVWLSGSFVKERSLFSFQKFIILKVFFFDVLLQRRLFKISGFRWMLHALIFYSFVIRFTWGFVALICSLWLPDWTGTWIMMDKNHPATAFLFDFTGLLVIVGILMMIIQKIQRKSINRLDNMPKPDWPGYSLLAGIIFVGFILEGMRIAMTGNPEGASFAFIGYGISHFFSGLDLTNSYGYVWYLHAVLTGAFVVYLPFSRMFHMIMAPVALMMNAADNLHDKEKG